MCQQGCAFIKVSSLKIKHVPVVGAIFGNRGKFNNTPASQVAQFCVITFPDVKAALGYLLGPLQLTPKVSRLNFAGQVAAAYIHPRVFIYHASKELTTVSPLFADDLCALNKLGIVDDEQTAFTPAGEVFRFMETVGRQVPNASKRPTFVRGHHSLCGIFDHEKFVPSCNFHDLVHLAGNAGVMNRNNSLGLRCDSCFNQLFIQIKRVRANIHKHDFCPPQHKSVGRTNKGVTRHDDFVTRHDVNQQRRHFQGLGAGRGQQRLFAAQLLLKPMLALLTVFAISRYLVTAHGSQNVLVFVAGVGRAIKRDHWRFPKGISSQGQAYLFCDPLVDALVFRHKCPKDLYFYLSTSLHQKSILQRYLRQEVL